MVFYFTATGNSLYVAKQLDSAPVSIPQVFGRPGQTFSDSSIGVVCPIYEHEMPRMVKASLRGNTFQAEYFYIILTYGNRTCGAAEWALRFCRTCGIEPDYIKTVRMVDNFLPGFDMNEQKKIVKHVEEQIEAVRRDLAGHRRYVEPVTEEERARQRRILSESPVPPEERWKDIYRVTGHCVGCGICTRVCPAGCIHLVHGRASYGARTSRQCQGCMACINACPQKAITMTIGEINPSARYRNPHISLQEIIKANNQNGHASRQGEENS